MGIAPAKRLFWPMKKPVAWAGGCAQGLEPVRLHRGYQHEASAQRQGVGPALMQRARESTLYGPALETLDNNALTCRFDAGLGFIIGAVNALLFRNLDQPHAEETAIF